MNHYLILSYFLTITSIYCYDYCSNEECKCFENSMRCPMEPDEVVIHFNYDNDPDSVRIDCPRNIKTLELTNIPNIRLNQTKELQLYYCPIPNQPLGQILDKFSIKELDILKILHFPIGNVSLNSQLFKGLESIKTINLKGMSIIEFPEDIFINTPNLYLLDLESNNLRLKSNMFRYASALIVLDLSSNQLELIPDNCFADLGSLKQLALCANMLKHIDSKTFAGLDKLTILDLSWNKIKTISGDAFKSLKHLKSINLSNNKLKKISQQLFQSNRYLKYVMLNNNFHLKLPDYLFANLTNLKRVSLNGCQLQQLPENLFSSATNLKIIELQQNELTDLPKNVFKGLINVKKIILPNNKLSELGEAFQALENLKKLNVRNNEIKELLPEFLSNFISLESINLSRNKIVRIQEQTFSNKPHLRNVDLSYNKITDFGNIFEGSTNLEMLNLSHNKITTFTLEHFRFSSMNIYLDYNELNVVKMGDLPKGLNISLSLANNPHICDCHNYDFLEHIFNQKVRKKSVAIIGDLPCGSTSETLFPLVCPLPEMYGKCPEKCKCTMRDSNQSIIIDCASRNLTTFPFINLDGIPTDFEQTELHLENNWIADGLERLSGYENVTKLYLGNNRIREIYWLPPKLQVLYLEKNHISHLNDEIIHQLNNSQISTLFLEENPWNCDCHSVKFAEFLRRAKPSMNISYSLFCANTKQRLVDLTRSDLCQSQWKLILLVIFSLLLTVSITVALYYRHQQKIKIFLYSKNLCLWWVTEGEIDKDKKYDAFISYSHKDEAFVVEKLLPVLESDCRYELCLHYRNWIPGKLITSQITDSVLQSRRTLVILSENFLNSVWGKMEFRMAHTQAMAEGRVRVIIVVVGDVDINGLDDELKIYLKSNTYVKWGDPYFWNKLKYALPHNKIKVTGGSEEDFLIQSQPSSPSSIACTPSFV